MMIKVLTSFVRVYQLLVSPFLPANTCRFHPTCSQYAIDAITKYGALRGLLRSMRRLAKCHPLHPGGYDPA